MYSVREFKFPIFVYISNNIISCSNMDIIKNHSGCNYVADTRTGFENHPDDTKWVADVFIPTAVEYGCKIIYFIIDANNSLKEELEGQESDSSDKIEFKYIYRLDEIKQ